jgi:tRNA threonylcarbamoyladenosine modification (KEOPS) complex  Pcc1 subunit
MLKILVCNVHTVEVKSFTKKDLQLPNVLIQNNGNMKTAKFFFNFNTKEEAKIIAESLDPETKQKIQKTNVQVTLSKKTFSLYIEAKDVSSLRAACNSYLRWINTALNVKNTI